MSEPAVTAIVPAYNAGATLRASVQSVLQQTRSDFEVIIVDDGSTDATPEIGRRLADGDGRIQVHRQANQGLASARNAGIRQAATRYVAFLDSDDLWMPTFLEETIKALDRDPGAGFAYTDGFVLDDESRRIRRSTVMARQRPPVPPPSTARGFLRELVERNFVLAEATVRRSTLDHVGVFDQRLPAAEDYELWLRIVSRGYRAVRSEHLLVVRRDSASSMSKDARLMLDAHRDVWRIVAEEHPVPPEIKEVAQARARAMDEELRILDGTRRMRQLLRRLRRTAGRARQRVLRSRLWYEQPPPEVASAFPDLHRG